MSVVYIDEDTKLERLVAIKFLPRHIAANAEERELSKKGSVICVQKVEPEEPMPPPVRPPA